MNNLDSNESKKSDTDVSITMIVVIIALVILILMIASHLNTSSYKDRCHSNVHNLATHQAEIISTNSIKSIDGKKIVSGSAKLQNGFGAWTNYLYTCEMTEEDSNDVTLEKGYRR